MQRKRSTSPEPKDARQRVMDLRKALLNLHKVLIASERVRYEKTVGKIQSPNQFLQLLTSDSWFAWLRPLSQLIVAMDEALDGKEPLTVAERQYFEALQRDPDAVLAHAEVTRLRGPRKASAL